MTSTPHETDRPKGDDYLWSGRGPVDADVAELERALSRFRYADRPMAVAPAASVPRRRWSFLAIAASILIVIATWGIAFHFNQQGDDAASSNTWSVTSIAGRPLIENAAVARSGRLQIGQTLVTDEQSQATVAVANIGHVTVRPNSKLRLLTTQHDEHRLALDRGEIHALIFAPPRLFFVDTRAATAVDYGCEYTLAIDEAGDGVLSVNLGLVMLERDGREVVVPADFACRMRAGIGPGTPYATNASGDFQRALLALDFERGGETALAAVLAHASVLDTITLWHLLERVQTDDRGRVFDRLAEFASPPEGVTRSGVTNLDSKMLAAWKRTLQSRW